VFSSNVVMKCNDVSLFFLLLCSSATDMEGDDISMNRSSPAISLASRRVMASQVSVPPSGTAPHPSPDSVPGGCCKWQFVEDTSGDECPTIEM